MKEKIHPKLFEVKARCSCGHEFETQYTSPELNISICSHCHPFYTGKQKILDTAGRVEKFNRRYEVAKQVTTKKTPRTITIS